MKPLVIRGSIAALEERLAADVAAYRAHTPLSPLTILIGSNLLRPYLRRRLAERLGGLVNVRLLTMYDLSSRLSVASTQSNGTKPLPPLGDRIIAEEVTEQADDYFAGVAQAPGFADVLERVLQVLRQAGLNPASFRRATEKLSEELPPSAKKLRSLAGLFAQAQQRREKFHGPDDLLRLSDPARIGGSALFVYGIWSVSSLQQALVARLMEQVSVTVYLPHANSEIDDVHGSLRDWLQRKGAAEEILVSEPTSSSTLGGLQSGLFAPPTAPVTALDGTVKLVSAPDPPREVREAARACLRWAKDGIAFHEMAIAYRQTEVYRGLIDEVFRQAQIPVYLHDGRPLIERPIGRSLSSLLALIGSRLTRAAVMEFLTETSLPATTQERYEGFEPAAWDQISREAGIVEGREQWQTRLKQFKDRLENRYVNEDGQSEYTTGRLTQIEQLTEFVGDLFERLDDWPSRDTWVGYRDRLRALAVEYIDDAELVIDKLHSLDRLSEVAHEVTIVRFIRTVNGALQRIDSDTLSGEPDGAFARQGVNALDVNSLRHLRFRAVIVLGLIERSFPPPPRQDALLLDHERAALNKLIEGEISPRETGPDPETLQFSLAVGAARERLVLCYARGEAGGTRSHLPSYFFRAAAETLTGKSVAISAIDSLPSELFERIPANRFGAATPEEALTPGEYDRTLVSGNVALGKSCLIRRSPTFARACLAWDARWRSNALTVWDGVLNPADQVKVSRNRSISPTRLENYATCPYRYFLQSVLRLEEIEEPETIERLSALDRGSLIHDILECFLSQCSTDLSKGETERAHLQTQLHSVAEKLCEEAEGRGESGYPLVWEFDKAAIFEDLDRWLEIELQEQQRSHLHPRAFEVRFGPSWHGDDQSTEGFSVEQPVSVTLDGRILGFHGRIDRIDLSDDDVPVFRVIDYKTGHSSTKGKDQFTQGKTLQLPIYLLAAAHALQQHGCEVSWHDGTAEYFYSTSRGGFRRVRFSGAALASRWKDFHQLLGDMTDQIARGDFHPEPGPNGDNCRYCLGQQVCDVRIVRLSERKAESRESRFLRLQEID